MPGGHLSPYPAKVRERAVRSLISAGGVVLICPVGARTAAGRGWRLGSRRGRAACASKACPKQGRRAYAPPQGPPTRSRPSLHPGLYHPTSGSPHPDTRWWAQTVTPPTAPASTQRSRATKPTTVPSHLQNTPCPPPSCTLGSAGGQGAPTAHTRQHARTSS